MATRSTFTASRGHPSQFQRGPRPGRFGLRRIYIDPALHSTLEWSRAPLENSVRRYGVMDEQLNETLQEQCDCRTLCVAAELADSAFRRLIITIVALPVNATESNNALAMPIYQFHNTQMFFLCIFHLVVKVVIPTKRIIDRHFTPSTHDSSHCLSCLLWDLRRVLEDVIYRDICFLHRSDQDGLL